MKPSISVLCLLVASTTCVYASDATAATSTDSNQKSLVQKWLKPGEYMPLESIKPGMTGYGLTVFKGTRVERFNIQVIGTIKQILNDRDALLVKLTSPIMARYNVIRGMSGSPVYINGKLVGAVSFGFDFSKEPIVGVTPVADMLDALSPEARKQKPLASLPPPAFPFHATFTGGTPSQVSGGSPQVVPLISPISLSGFSPRAQQFLSRRFEKLGLPVSAGISGAPDPRLARDPGASSVKPGSALSILLSDGDFASVSTATCTARFGDNIIGFGHPFISAGAIDFPMHSAYVHQVLPSLFISFKLASPLKEVGTFTADRPWSVGGQLGKKAKMIPATYKIIDKSRNLTRTYKCRLVDHQDLTPEMLAATAISALDTTHQSAGPYLATMKSHIEAEGIEPIDRVDCFSTNFFGLQSGFGGDLGLNLFPDPLGGFLLNTTKAITRNDFQKSSIRKVDLEITLEDGLKIAELKEVHVDKPTVEPGGTINLTCLLKPFNKAEYTETISLKIPRTTPDGDLLVGVSSGSDIAAVRKKMKLTEPVPRSLKQIVQQIERQGTADSLSVLVALPEQALIVNGKKLSSPPAYWSNIFFSNRHTSGPSLVGGEIHKTKNLDRMVKGTHYLTVNVKAKNKFQARPEPFLLPPRRAENGIQSTDAARKAMTVFGKSKSSSKVSSGSTQTGSSDSSSDSPAPPPSTEKKTSTESKSPGKDGKSADYPHMRPASSWKQHSESSFRQGEAIHSAIDSWGRILPGLKELSKQSLADHMQIWSAASSSGSFWFATQDTIWRWAGDSSPPEPVGSIDSVAIPAMTADSKGTVYFAGAPGGRVWSASAGRKPEVLWNIRELGDGLITSLATDDQDNLYIGVAGRGQVYKSEAGEYPRLFFDSGQGHVLCLFYSRADSRLYVGTGENGAVYSLDKSGKAKAEFQSPDHLITGVARDKKGNLFVTSAAKGYFIRVRKGGETETLALSDAFYKLIYDESSDTVFAGDAEGDITKAVINPQSKLAYFVPVCHTREEAVLALATDGTNRLFAGTSNLASVRCFKMEPADNAVYESVIRDAGRQAKWFGAQVFGAFEEVDQSVRQKISMQTRSGQTERPDETWSAWTPCTWENETFKINSPDARYLQFRIKWKTAGASPEHGEPDKPFEVGAVTVCYLPADLPPKINNISIKSGDTISGKKKLSISGSDPDSDNLLLSISISRDLGKSWKEIAGDLRSKSSSSDKKKDTKSSTDKSDKKPEEKNADKEKDKSGKEEKDSAGKVIKESEDRDKPGEKPDKLKSSLRFLQADKPEEGKSKEKSKEGKKEKGKKKSAKAKKKLTRKKGKKQKGKKSGLPPWGRQSSKSTGPVEKFSWTWDTKKFDEGNYIVKFIMDDRLSNPDNNRTSLRMASVVVDNSKPAMKLVDSTRNADGSIRFKISATDKYTPIDNATYKLDGGEPFAMAALSSTYGSRAVELGFTSLKAKKGKHKIEVTVYDAAGNSRSKTFTVR